jgi:hypothetical protein
VRSISRRSTRLLTNGFHPTVYHNKSLMMNNLCNNNRMTIHSTRMDSLLNQTSSSHIRNFYSWSNHYQQQQTDEEKQQQKEKKEEEKKKDEEDEEDENDDKSSQGVCIVVVFLLILYLLTHI